MDKNILHKSWVHSQEEDTDSEMVFRPSDYNLPPLRGGRAAIDLRNDESFTQRGNLNPAQSNLGADDRYNTTEGNWNLETNTNTLSLTPNSQSGPVNLKVLALDNDKLVLGK